MKSGGDRNEFSDGMRKETGMLESSRIALIEASGEVIDEHTKRMISRPKSLQETLCVCIHTGHLKYFCIHSIKLYTECIHTNWFHTSILQTKHSLVLLEFLSSPNT